MARKLDEAIRQEMQPFVERLERLDQHLGPAGE
jgi:hypothetical protein